MSDQFLVNELQKLGQGYLLWLMPDRDRRIAQLLPSDFADSQNAQPYRALIPHIFHSANSRRPDEVLFTIEDIRRLHPWPNPIIFQMWMLALLAEGRGEEVLDLYWAYAQHADGIGLYEIVLDACQSLLLEDMSQKMSWFNNPERLQQVAALYEKIFQAINTPKKPAVQPIEGKFRIGMVVPNLAYPGPPYARRVLHFARYLDKERFELFVYSSEGLCKRSSPTSSYRLGGPSQTHPYQPVFIEHLNDLGAQVHYASTEESILQTAKSLARKMEEDRLNVVIIQSGLTVPADWMAVRMTSIPVKLHIHIGISNYMPSLDYTLFDNAANLSREQAAWPEGCGKAKLLRRGTDIKVLDSTPAGDRCQLGIPEDAVVIGVLSNNFKTRFSMAYAKVLCEVLHACPEVWFVPVGSSTLPPEIIDCFQKEGVHDRLLYIPFTKQPASELKMMDIYASEFPHGGSQSVVEAMVCGLPVVAMRTGDTHYESISADIVGDMAIQENRPDLYKNQLIEWVQNPTMRQQAARNARYRAEQYFSVEKYIERITLLAEMVLRRKCGEHVDEQKLFE